jgi:hypothetical protein
MTTHPFLVQLASRFPVYFTLTRASLHVIYTLDFAPIARIHPPLDGRGWGIQRIIPDLQVWSRVSYRPTLTQLLAQFAPQDVTIYAGLHFGEICDTCKRGECDDSGPCPVASCGCWKHIDTEGDEDDSQNGDGPDSFSGL